MKNCIKCSQLKALEAYPKDSRTKQGYRNVCKNCVSARFYNWAKASGHSEYKKQHFKENYTELKAKQDAYRLKHQEKINKRARDRRKTDVNFKIAQYLRNRVNAIIQFEYKAGSAIKDLGCSVSELKQYLETKFQSGMSWDNYGDWHIDHIFPLSKADLSNKEQFLKVCHYTNLQPLWAVDNIRKSNKLD